jgi:hypothetical protein
MRSIRVPILVLAACNAHIQDDDVLLSGAVRWDLDSQQPVDRAFVRVTDANNSHRCFVTDCEGKFTVRRGDVPFLTMPLSSISVERVDRPEAPASSTTRVASNRMSGRIGIARACETCHARGVPLLPSGVTISEQRRAPSVTCAPGAAPVAILCPEDRPIPNDQLELTRDFATYASSVHVVLARRCGSLDCHGGTEHALRISADREASFASVMAHDATLFMTKAHGGAGHGGGQVIFVGDPADQCVADWLGVPRGASGPTPSDKLTHADACALAATMQ